MSFGQVWRQPESILSDGMRRAGVTVGSSTGGAQRASHHCEVLTDTPTSLGHWFIFQRWKDLGHRPISCFLNPLIHDEAFVIK